MSNLPILTPQETHFATINNRQLAKGPYTTNALAEHLSHHTNKKGAKQWCHLSCACRVFGLRATEENMKSMRRRFSRAATEFLPRGYFLLKKYGHHGDLQEVKFYDNTSEEDRAWAKQQYELAREKGEDSEEKLAMMKKILGFESISSSGHA